MSALLPILVVLYQTLARMLLLLLRHRRRFRNGHVAVYYCDFTFLVITYQLRILLHLGRATTSRSARSIGNIVRVSVPVRLAFLPAVCLPLGVLFRVLFC